MADEGERHNVMAEKRIPPSEYVLEARYGIAILEDYWTGVPNMFLNLYNYLGIDDSMAMFLIHVMKFKWDARAPYPRRRRLPMTACEKSRATYTRKLRKMGLLFTRRRYHTTETAPTPADVGKQASMEYDLETIFHNTVRMKRHLAAGLPVEAFSIELPFGIVYWVVTRRFHDVPTNIYDQCRHHLEVSDDAIKVLQQVARLGRKTPSSLVDAQRLLAKAGLSRTRARVAVEHLIESDLIKQVTPESDKGASQVRVLTEAELEHRPGLLLREENPPPQKSGGNDTPQKGEGSDTLQKRDGSDTPQKREGSDTLQKHTGKDHTGMFLPPLKEESALKKKQPGEEKTGKEEKEEETSCSSSPSSSTPTLLRAFNVQEPKLTRLSGSDPLITQAWIWWTSLSDMELARWPGYVITRLEQGDSPPEEFYELARAMAALDEDDLVILWQASRWRGMGRYPVAADFPIPVGLWQIYHRLFKAGAIPEPPGAADALAASLDTEEDPASFLPATLERQGPDLPAGAVTEQTLWSLILEIHNLTAGGRNAWLNDVLLVDVDGSLFLVAPDEDTLQLLEDTRYLSLVRKDLQIFAADRAETLQTILMADLLAQFTPDGD